MDQRINNMIFDVEGWYNADNDIIPGTPRVTHTDYTLLQIIEELKLRIEALELQLVGHENGGYAKHEHGYSHD